MATKITAKVIVSGKTDVVDDQTRLVFQPDYADGANAEWAKYTPALALDMVVKGDVADQFEQGAHFTLTFEKD